MNSVEGVKLSFERNQSSGLIAFASIPEMNSNRDLESFKKNEPRAEFGICS
jgi:hypothetical protein